MLNTKVIFAAILMMCSFIYMNAQTTNFKDPDEFLVKGDKLPEVLLVGTFHFSYPNLDAHVTDADKQVNVKDAQRQKEIKELTDYIAKFKPTKIVVESWPNSNTNDRYRQFLKGEYELRKGEGDQLAFRLAKQFGLDSLYLCDAPTLVRSLSSGPDSTCINPYLEKVYEDWDFRSDDKISNRYNDWYEYQDEMLTESTLLEAFQYMNDIDCIRRGHGAYLNGDFSLGDTRGADALAMHWYSRNLRIYRNIQKITTSPDDRIMVLYGAGHLGILQQQFESSPQYKLIPFNSLAE